jgi:uncharacterized protein YneF (UPF0154 family)
MLHHVTARLLLGAMVFLALGMCGDFYVVCRITGIGMGGSTTLALLLLAFFYGAWFGYTLWKKHAAHNPDLTTSHLKDSSAA